MKGPQQQRGMSIFGLLAIAIMVGFFVMCAVKMVPRYIEYRAIERVVGAVAREFNQEEDTISDARKKLANLFNTNQFYDLDYKDVEIYREEGETYIDASYEVRVPLFWRIDAVMKFDDLLFETGQVYDN